MKNTFVLSIVISLFILLDIYIWKAFRFTVSPSVFNIIKWLIPLSTIILLVIFSHQMFKTFNLSYSNTAVTNVIFAISLGVLITKIIIFSVFFIEDIYRVGDWIVQKLSKKSVQEVNFSDRRNFVKNISLGVAALPFIGSIYAAVKGKYNYHTKILKLHFDNLPASFDGLKVVQFSDFHAGSFDDYNKVKKGLELINEENPDIILFTGDLVNNRAAEAQPYMDLFKSLKAKYGKFAVLGNHDYGDYIPFKNKEERIENLQEIETFFQKTGFQLLKNESISIENDKDSIDLIGVENWGTGHFPKYGNIEKAIQAAKEERFNILMSHDPDHWEYEIREHRKKFDLTLSGHTHGSQVGINIPNFKWSPIKYRYKRWLGLYQENNRYLFVSKGFGFLGYPGRLGMWPEIVVLNLHSKNDKLHRF